MYFRILSVRPIFDDDFGDAANDRLHLGMARASVGLDRGCDKVAFAVYGANAVTNSINGDSAMHQAKMVVVSTLTLPIRVQTVGR